MLNAKYFVHFKLQICDEKCHCFALYVCGEGHEFLNIGSFHLCLWNTFTSFGKA